MDKLDLVQKYFLCVTDEKGKLPFLNETETEEGLVRAALWDLKTAAVITILSDVIEVRKDLPEKLGYLYSLYEYLGVRPRTCDQVIADYILRWRRRQMNKLWADIGEELVFAGVAEANIGGSWGRRILYIPNGHDQKELYCHIRRLVSGAEPVPADLSALIEVLKDSGNLDRYMRKP